MTGTTWTCLDMVHSGIWTNKLLVYTCRHRIHSSVQDDQHFACLMLTHVQWGTSHCPEKVLPGYELHLQTVDWRMARIQALANQPTDPLLRWQAENSSSKVHVQAVVNLHAFWRCNMYCTCNVYYRHFLSQPHTFQLSKDF